MINFPTTSMVGSPAHATPNVSPDGRVGFLFLSATARYEMMKADWIRANQFATPEAYQDAMREIAKRCGV